VICDFAVEAAIVAKVGPSVTGDLITFVCPIPLEVDAACGEAAVERRFQCSEGHAALALGVDLDEGGSAKIEMSFCPGQRFR